MLKVDFTIPIPSFNCLDMTLVDVKVAVPYKAKMRPLPTYNIKLDNSNLQ